MTLTWPWHDLTDLRLAWEKKMNIVSSGTLYIKRRFAFLELLTEPKILQSWLKSFQHWPRYSSPRSIVISCCPPSLVTRGSQSVGKVSCPLNIPAQTWLCSCSLRNHRVWRSFVKPFVPGINTPWDRRCRSFIIAVCISELGKSFFD